MRKRNPSRPNNAESAANHTFPPSNSCATRNRKFVKMNPTLVENKGSQFSTTQDIDCATLVKKPESLSSLSLTTGNLTSTMTWNGAFQPTGATNPNRAITGLAHNTVAGNTTTPTTLSSSETQYAPYGCTPIEKVKCVSQLHAPGQLCQRQQKRPNAIREIINIGAAAARRSPFVTN